MVVHQTKLQRTWEKLTTYTVRILPDAPWPIYYTTNRKWYKVALWITKTVVGIFSKKKKYNLGTFDKVRMPAMSFQFKRASDEMMILTAADIVTIQPLRKDEKS